MNFLQTFRSACAVMLMALAAVSFANAPERVNVNTADAETIATVLVGVGLRKAEAIVEHRTKNGRFKDLTDLTLVKGIGAATVEKNADRIVLSGTR